MAKFWASPFWPCGSVSSVSLLIRRCLVPMKSVNESRTSARSTFGRGQVLAPYSFEKNQKHGKVPSLGHGWLGELKNGLNFEPLAFEFGEWRNSGNHWFSHVSNDCLKFELLKIVSTYRSMISFRSMTDSVLIEFAIMPASLSSFVNVFRSIRFELSLSWTRFVSFAPMKKGWLST